MSDPTKSPEDIVKERFERRSALTVAILAAVCAFATLCASNTCSDTLLAATNAADEWGHYQSNSMKGHTYEVERDFAEMLLPTAVDETKRHAFVETCKKQTTKYAEGKEKSKEKAEGFQKDTANAARRNSNYGVAALLLQVAIVVVSISILVRKNFLWAGGTLAGLAGGAITVATACGLKFALTLPY